jgi:predicted HicB family RNase H-like nuclease
MGLEYKMKETFKYKGFEGSMEFSSEDECLVGEVLFIRSKIIYIGETYSELKQSFEEAVDAYILHCEANNIKPEKPCSGTFNVRVGTHLHQSAIKLAYQNNISLNEVVIRALEHFLATDHTESSNFTVNLKNSPVNIMNISQKNILLPKKRSSEYFN